MQRCKGGLQRQGAGQALALLFLAVWLGWSLTVAAAPAAATQAEAVASVSMSSNHIQWYPLRQYDQIVLTVDGPEGFYAHRVFAAGQTPFFGLLGDDGQRCADGQYTWELRAAAEITDELRRRQAAARISGDEAALQNLRDETAAYLAGVPLAQAGTFRVAGGRILTGGAAEADEPSGDIANDQVILDDLIVDGSACIGFDCVDGESFGFDTLRLKENNLRIKFDDTSTTAEFPSVDWQLTANDSENGGADKFSIDDITNARTPFTILAGAPSNSLFVDGQGDVGLGTSTPLLELHMVDSDTPTVRLEQDGSGGWSPQTWDVAGNETNFFIRDVTHGSQLSFRIMAGAPANSLYIAADGDVGVGIASPTAKLHVDGDALITGNLELGSSRDYKENIEGLTLASARRTLDKLRPVSFTRRENPQEPCVGFIAEEMPDDIAPEGKKSIRPVDILAVLTRVVQQQQAEETRLARTVEQQHQTMEQQRRTIAQLQEKIAALEKRLEARP
jgi:hypothetical protein